MMASRGGCGLFVIDRTLHEVDLWFVSLIDFLMVRKHHHLVLSIIRCKILLKLVIVLVELLSLVAFYMKVDDVALVISFFWQSSIENATFAFEELLTIF